MSVSYVFPIEPSANAKSVLKSVLLKPVNTYPIVKRDTKSIGDRSEAMVLSKLVELGYLVSIPFGENHRYDVIADSGDRLLRIQVKTGRLKNGIINFICSSSHQHRRSGPTASRSYFGQIEHLAVFCPGTGKVYLIPESDMVATKGHLRVDPCLNNQVRNIRWAADYELP